MKNPAHAALDIDTRLVNAGRAGTRAHGFVNPPVVRGSTVLHADCADRAASHRKILDQALIYGIEGTPTHFALEDVIAEIEGGTRCQLVSTGLAAITVPLLAYVKAGAHLLMPDSVYGPARDFCDGLLTRLGVETTYYPPTLPADAVGALIRDNTALLFAESPGSHTFEMQDIAALASAAHAHGVPLMLDNTWGVHFFQPFQHGVDVSIQALTKYVGGHSDVLLGAITVNDPAHWETVRMAAMVLGQYASSDDVWLALRGARTLLVRLHHQMESGLAIARWFVRQPEVLEVRHPALPGAPGHALWQRDFTGAPSLFGVVFRPEITTAKMIAMIDALTLFGIGASWGGFESLALPSTNLKRVHGSNLGGPAARFHIGLEKVSDLIADLEQAFAALRP
jgi:cystathionine beta-lyase